MTIPGATVGSRFLYFQKCFVFIGGGSADVTHSRQLADVQLPVFVGGIVPQKYGGDGWFPGFKMLLCCLLDL